MASLRQQGEKAGFSQRVAQFAAEAFRQFHSRYFRFPTGSLSGSGAPRSLVIPLLPL